MPKMILCAAAILIASVSTAAAARGQFVAFDGNGALQEGTGGTYVASNGVDFWTNGTPPRRFEILGTLTDTRSAGVAARSSIGSSMLARQARSLGADGLVLVGQRRRDGGFVGAWSGGDSISLGSRVTFTTTTFAVVRYLD